MNSGKILKKNSWEIYKDKFCRNLGKILKKFREDFERKLEKF